MDVCEEKDIGVIFYPQLSFDTNASKVMGAANSRLVLINTRHIVAKRLMNYYTTLVRPNI